MFWQLFLFANQVMLRYQLVLYVHQVFEYNIHNPSAEILGNNPIIKRMDKIIPKMQIKFIPP